MTLLEQLNRDIDQMAGHYNQLVHVRDAIVSGKIIVECQKSFNSYHQWRTIKTDTHTATYNTVLPFCYYCGIIDKTNTQKDTPIAGDRNWHDRPFKIRK